MSEILHTFRRKNLREKAATLVVTLLVLTLLSTIVVAFVQSVSMERSAARSVANRYQAELAAEAGFGYVAGLLSKLTANDHYIVYANNAGQLFVGNGTQSPGEYSYTPLFSTTTNVSSNVTVTTKGLPTVNTPSGNIFTNKLPGDLSVTSPPITWISLTNSSNQTIARFAFWVEDLGGKLDLSVVGANNAADGRRPTGTNASEIALWSIFDTNSASDPGNAAASALIAARQSTLTPATARLVHPEVTTDRLVELAANLRHDTNEPQVIPFGFGYADQGRPKFDLNTNASPAALPFLVSAMTNNLRNTTNSSIAFASNSTSTGRSGGMSGLRYVNALAASMIDYVDTDNTPTVGSAGGGDFRGIEGLPFVTETATAIQWMAHGTNISGFEGVWADEIHLENYVEFWNPSDKAFSGTVDVVFSNDYACGSVGGFPIDLRITQNTGSSTVSNASHTPPNYKILVNPALEPNEYRVFSLGTNVYRFKVANSGSTADDPTYQNGRKATNGGLLYAGKPPGGQGSATSYGSNITISINGVAYDRVFAIERIGGRRLDLESVATGNNKFPAWAGNVPALRMTPRQSDPFPGDPRMGFYLTSTNAAQGYDSTPSNPGSSMGFRNNGTSSEGIAYNTEPNQWLDSGHTSSPRRSATITRATRPSTNRQTTAHSSEFVQRLNDTGRWTNILELGNIFDPMAWRIPLNTPHILSTHTPAGDGTSSITNGGGKTLRIGRVENPRFTNDGLRASQLLDLFAVGPKVGNSVVSRVPGRINLNTATTNTLRALAAGVRHSVDASMKPASLDVPPSAVSAFVTGVTNYRSQRPFYSTSELNLLSANKADAANWVDGAVFGRANLLGVTAWGDQAAEEWFSRIYHLSTVRSRNFLVHVIGQSLQPNNPDGVLSTTKQVYQIYAEPIRDANGLTTNSAMRIIRQWEL